MKTRTLLLCATMALTSLTHAPAQPGYIPSADNLKARETFQDDKFGIFIHWGIYSMLADGEWVMHNKNLNW